MTEIDFAQAALVIDRIAKIAEAVGVQAGVGGMETAGGIVSYLAEHPKDIEPCLRFGIFELPADWIERGCLTWQGQNGKVVKPDFVRRARVIQSLSNPVTRGQ